MVPRPRPTLRRLTPGDRGSFLEAVSRSRSLHRPWAYPPDTPDAFDTYMEVHPSRRTLAVVVDHEEPLVGVYTVSQIHHGSFRNAYLGYYAFRPHAGDGYMREAMPLVFRYAFGELRLHRLQANVQPGNERSLGLLRATGWREEGYARRYLKVGGRWRDHVLFAILAEDVRTLGR
ncbi:MAG: GNAT family N-acetyltransferase [Actinomycetota bacterium]|nr:GNAT family N-acetyltransferase [Actinomycetota bacterium]